MKVYDGTASGSDSPGETQTERRKVGIAESAVATDPGVVVTTSGLGSCLGVAVYDTRAGIAGLVHAMLPSRDELDGTNPQKFTDTGIEALVEEMEAAGGDRRHMEAKIAGGSDMLDFSDQGASIGARNAECGRSKLADLDIPIVGEDVGGEFGRSLRLEVDGGTLVVTAADRDPIRL